MVIEPPVPSADAENSTLLAGQPTIPSIGRRIAAIPYEGLLLIALLLIVSFPFAGLAGKSFAGMGQIFFQIYILGITATYFVWQWQKNGQTLAMKTWRFCVVDQFNQTLSWPRALLRFIFSAIFFVPAAIGSLLLFFPGRMSPVISMWFFLPLITTLLYARFDGSRQFLHDRLAGTQLIDAPPPGKK